MNREDNSVWLQRVSSNCEAIKGTVIPAPKPNGETELDLRAHVKYRFTRGDEGKRTPWTTPPDMHVCAVTIYGIPVDLPEAVLRKIESELMS